MSSGVTTDALQALIVGAGPAGLATAACLQHRGIEAVMLEAAPEIASSWRRHYTRLHLHTTKELSHLPGLEFAAQLPRYPARADVVAYLEEYALRFALTPRTGEAVRAVRASDRGFVVESTRARYEARAVVLAAGYNRVPNPERLPEQARFVGTLIHSAEYRDGEAFAGRRVLVVGAGNTGAEIALDLAERGAKPTLAVRTPVNIVPRDFLGMPTQLTSLRLRRAPLKVADALGRMVSRLAFGDLAPYGLARPDLGPISTIKLRRRIPIIDVGTVAAIKRGEIAVKPAVDRLTETGAAFVDGSAEDFDAVVLATGFRPALEEIVKVPGVLDGEGYPLAWRGGAAAPNLFFVGYANVATGLLREIALQAQAVAEVLSDP